VAVRRRPKGVASISCPAGLPPTPAASATPPHLGQPTQPPACPPQSWHGRTNIWRRSTNPTGEAKATKRRNNSASVWKPKAEFRGVGHAALMSQPYGSTHHEYNFGCNRHVRRRMLQAFKHAGTGQNMADRCSCFGQHVWPAVSCLLAWCVGETARHRAVRSRWARCADEPAPNGETKLTTFACRTVSRER
jgi:hypothetical protein